MKFVTLLIFCFLLSCTPEDNKPQEAFNPEKVISFFISNDGKSDDFLRKNNSFIHDPHGYYLSQEKTRAWLKQLSHIKDLKSETPKFPIHRVISKIIEIRVEGSRILFQGGNTGDAYYAYVQSFPAKENAISGLFYLTKENFQSLFKTASGLRIDHLPVSEATKIQYEFQGKLYDLTSSQIQIVKEAFGDIRLNSYIHDGPVTNEIKDKYYFGQRMNGNVPGYIHLTLATGKLTLSFAKPNPHDPLTYIHVLGRNEIYAVMINKWQNIEITFGKLLHR